VALDEDRSELKRPKRSQNFLCTISHKYLSRPVIKVFELGESRISRKELVEAAFGVDQAWHAF